MRILNESLESNAEGMGDETKQRRVPKNTCCKACCLLEQGLYQEEEGKARLLSSSEQLEDRAARPFSAQVEQAGAASTADWLKQTRLLPAAARYPLQQPGPTCARTLRASRQ